MKLFFLHYTSFVMHIGGGWYETTLTRAVVKCDKLWQREGVKKFKKRTGNIMIELKLILNCLSSYSLLNIQ